MTDKELLGLAAKACGFEVRIYSGMCVDRGTDCVCVTKDGLKWNPLTDDGDALQLAMKLGISIHYVAADDGKTIIGVLVNDCELEEINENDVVSAARRAIVRAAAEIGKTL